MPAISLNAPTTITFPPDTTSLEVAWPTVHVVTLPGGAVSVSTGLERTIQTAALTIPPVTTTNIDLWNWRVTDPDAPKATYVLMSSILPSPPVVTDRLPQKRRR
ncbi:hypothetical protein PABG_11373 [Paracoccidioides brasiliensis Pb03]|nr:hypothetical protein PABG_11373 [Paracoccidioides brasiliensis Pb03]